MAQTIRISDADYKKAQEAAEINNRSLAGQIQHWINIGRIIEQSPGFSMARVEAAMKAELALGTLTPDEQEVFMDDFYESMRNPDEAAEAFYKQLGEDAKAVGYTGE